jgi:asparagine synthase (glutamine-hydrolysing)
MFKHIFKLQPAHFLVLEGGHARVGKYWDLEYQQPEPRPDTYYLERFNELLEESVRLRLIAEVPLGVFLSGGLDSSSILAVMSRITGGSRIKTFSVGYQGSHRREEAANEFHFARLAAKTFGTEHHEFRLGVTDLRDFLPGLVWHLDEPLADDSCIPLYFLSKLAREYITVILSGEGADEVLAGYHIYEKMLGLETVRRTLGSWAPWLAARLASLMPSEARRNHLRQAALPLEARYKGVSRGFRPELKRRLLNCRGASKSDEILEELFAHYFKRAAHASPLDRMLYVDTKVWLPDDILLKGDKMTMANALELRVPFLDHKLVEFAATVPVHLKLNRGCGKFLLRQAMRDVVPQAILKRSKKGFPVPTAHWLRGQLRSFTRETLLAPDSACRLYFNLETLEETVREHEQGRVNREQEIWTLMIFEFWHKVFVERRFGWGTQPTEAAVEVVE